MMIQATRATVQATNADLARAEFMDVNLHAARFSNINLPNVEIEACDTAHGLAAC